MYKPHCYLDIVIIHPYVQMDPRAPLEWPWSRVHIPTMNQAKGSSERKQHSFHYGDALTSHIEETVVVRLSNRRYTCDGLNFGCDEEGRRWLWTTVGCATIRLEDIAVKGIMDVKTTKSWDLWSRGRQCYWRRVDGALLAWLVVLEGARCDVCRRHGFTVGNWGGKLLSGKNCGGKG
jgi:hypothetical protein